MTTLGRTGSSVFVYEIKEREKMNYQNYFNKNGCVYGLSTKFDFGRRTGYAIKFTNLDEAEKWLETEEQDFRERELCSKTKANRI